MLTIRTLEDALRRERARAHALAVEVAGLRTDLAILTADRNCETALKNRAVTNQLDLEAEVTRMKEDLRAAEGEIVLLQTAVQAAVDAEWFVQDYFETPTKRTDLSHYEEAWGCRDCGAISHTGKAEDVEHSSECPVSLAKAALACHEARKQAAATDPAKETTDE
jgi:hypothetical protein